MWLSYVSSIYDNAREDLFICWKRQWCNLMRIRAYNLYISNAFRHARPCERLLFVSKRKDKIFNYRKKKHLQAHTTANAKTKVKNFISDGRAQLEGVRANRAMVLYNQ